MGPTIVFIAFFAIVFGIFYLFFTTRNKERMALIDKGADASLFATVKTGSSFSWSKFSLKIGMLAIGIAVGIITAALLAPTGIIDEDALYSSMILIFGGFSLVLFYIIDREIK
jgi:hypothetical protein